MHLDGSRICQALNLNKYESVEVLLRICRGAVKNLSMVKSPRWIEILLRIYRLDRNFLDGSKSYWDKVQKARWIENAIRYVEIRSSRGSIDRNLSRICREVVELDKKEFSKIGKTQKDKSKQASYSNIDPINMLNSQKHVSTKTMQSNRSKTHTHN